MITGKEIGAIILAGLKLITLVISFFLEKNIDKKKMKREAIKEVKEGIKNNDPSKITAGFDRIR